MVQILRPADRRPQDDGMELIAVLRMTGYIGLKIKNSNLFTAEGGPPLAEKFKIRNSKFYSLSTIHQFHPVE